MTLSEKINQARWEAKKNYSRGGGGFSRLTWETPVGKVTLRCSSRTGRNFHHPVTRLELNGKRISRAELQEMLNDYPNPKE